MANETAGVTDAEIEEAYVTARKIASRATHTQRHHREPAMDGATDAIMWALKHWRPLEMELWVRKGPQPCTFRGQRGVGPRLDD